MTDQEYKEQIIRKNFMKVAEKSGMSVEDAEDAVEPLMQELNFVQCINLCMDEWAGVISARIDEDDEDKRREVNYS